MSRTAALRDLYNKISVLDFSNGGEPWDELTDEQRTAATTAIEALLPPLIEKPSGLPFDVVGDAEVKSFMLFVGHNISPFYADAVDGRLACVRNLLAERAHLTAQVKRLHIANTRFTNRARDAEWMLAGMAARMGGEPIESCSFEEGSDETKLWRSGWEQVNSSIIETVKRITGNNERLVKAVGQVLKTIELNNLASHFTFTLPALKELLQEYH